MGAHFYVEARVPDARTVLVNIGKDYYLDMGLDEAHRWIAARDKALTTRLGALNEEATRQASMVAYVDLYHALFLVALAIMPLILFLRPIGMASTGPPPSVEH